MNPFSEYQPSRARRGFARAFVGLVALAWAFAAQAQSSDPSAWPQYFDGVNNNLGPYAWLTPADAAARGLGPANAVSGGQAGNTQLPVCRAAYEGGIHPGKEFAGQCNIGWGGQEIAVSSNFEVLYQTQPQDAQYFPQLWGAQATGPAFVGGQAGDTPLPVCRAAYEGGIHPGKEFANNCNIGWGGQEVALAQYERLSLYNALHIAVNAAITKQIVPVNESDPVLVELVTLTQYPANLQHVSLETPAGFAVASMTPDDTSCPNTPGSSCRQRWLWALNPGQNCTLNGDYRANFNKVCAEGINCGAVPYSVPFSLQSENFCAETTVEGGTQ